MSCTVGRHKGFGTKPWTLLYSLRQLEFGDFDDFNVIGRRKYAELHEYAKKPYLMKIQALS